MFPNVYSPTVKTEERYYTIINIIRFLYTFLYSIPCIVCIPIIRSGVFSPLFAIFLATSQCDSRNSNVCKQNRFYDRGSKRARFRTRVQTHAFRTRALACTRTQIYSRLRLSNFPAFVSLTHIAGGLRMAVLLLEGVGLPL